MPGNARKGKNSSSSFATIGLIGFAVIGGVLLFSEHQAHVLPWLPWLILAACPLMHLFMHHGHGGQGGHGHHEAAGERGEPDLAATPVPVEVQTGARDERRLESGT